MTAKLVFRAVIRHGCMVSGVAIAIHERRGWPKLAPIANGGSEEAWDAAEIACHEINALLHAGFPLDALAAAARLSSSNHAEIVRTAWEAVSAHDTTSASFAP